MKRILLIFMVLCLVLGIAGCKKKNTNDNDTVSYAKVSEEQAVKMLTDDSALMEKKVKKDDITLQEITPDDVYNDTGCQIFKNPDEYESYLVFQGRMYHIGIGFGGYGIVDIQTCNFDDNDQMDIIFVYSWGSGTLRSEIGYFDLTLLEETQFEYSVAHDGGYGEIALEKLSDDRFDVYSTKAIGENDALSYEKDQKIAEIVNEGTKPVIKEWHGDESTEWVG